MEITQGHKGDSMEREIRNELSDMLFNAINRELADIEKRRLQHETWCEQNNQDPRNGIYTLMQEKLAVLRISPVIRAMRNA